MHLEESINSEYQKVNKSIKKISKKIVRGLKKRNEILINRVEFLRNRFTPKNSLQERNDSLIQYYAVHGENFMKMLKDNLNPLDNNFLFLETDDWKSNNIRFSEVLSSEWCRCKDTVKEMKIGKWKTFSGLNSFFQGYSNKNEVLKKLNKKNYGS